MEPQNIKKFLRGVKTNVPLKNYTTFRIGGAAEYFFTAKSKEDLMKAILAAQIYNLPFFILGGGSNLLVSDNGFRGLVIKIQNSKFQILDSKIIAESGVLLGKLVNISASKGLTGLEEAMAIPGTIGGAIRGNTGAFGKSMADVIKTVTVLEFSNSKFKFRIFENKDCKFDFRDSIFKRNPNLIILSAEIQLKRGDKKDIKEKMKKYLDYRKKNHPLNFPSIGCIFKNSKNFYAGELIEKCGLKGKRIGDVKVSEKHCNFIVNLGHGTAENVKELIKIIKQKAKEKFNIKLEEEIELL